MKKRFAFLLFCLVLISLMFIYGCGNVSGGGSDGGATSSGITKLFIANTSNGFIIFNLNTMTWESVVVLPGAHFISGITISPDKKIIYASEGASPHTCEVFAYDIVTTTSATLTVSTTMDSLGGYIAISPDGQRLFAPTYHFRGIVSIKTDTFTIENHSSSEYSGWGAGVVANNNYVYYAAGANIAKYNIANKTIEAFVAVPNAPDLWQIRFNPVGDKIYVPGDGGKVYILDVASFIFDPAYVTAEGLPVDVVFCGTKGYVQNYTSNTVTVFNIADNQVIKTITDETASGAQYLTVDAGRERIYMNGWQKPILSVISTATDTIIATYELPSISDQVAVY